LAQEEFVDIEQFMIFNLRILEKPEELTEVEQLQRLVWTGSELEIVPVHMLLASCHSGGLIIGAYPDTAPSAEASELAGFVFGFPGIYETPDGPRLKHYSHMLGVHPDYRNQGLGFRLKRAQWQMVRRQGIDRINWTYDPLLSPNAQLNIARLGAVCNTYLENFYGEMHDDLNSGLDTDRFEVDWWVNTRRVEHRLSREARAGLSLEHYLSAEVSILNPARFSAGQFPLPGEVSLPESENPVPLVLFEIPANFGALRQVDPKLAQAWRLHTRPLFQTLFAQGYLVTDFVHNVEKSARSYYVLTQGEAQIGGVVH
jgi:predicted GNAT superfamily acetyltransferase